MESRLFLMPTNQDLVAKAILVLENNGIQEAVVRLHSPLFTEIEAMGWNLITSDQRMMILGDLLEMNIHYLIKMKS